MDIKHTSPTRVLLAAALIGSMWPNTTLADGFCPPLYHADVFGPLDFNPAFTSVETFSDSDGRSRDGLLISSFFNAIKDPSGEHVVGFFEEDLVARMERIDTVTGSNFNPSTDIERLTDLGTGPAVTVWPNTIDRAPDGFLPFEAVVIPGGFHVTPAAGRLSIINLDDPGRQEYIIHQSTQTPGEPCAFPPEAHNAPRFYHQVRYVDMNQDGLLDLVTVRSSFKLAGGLCTPPVGEVVWFQNPGTAIDPNIPWQEHIVVGFPSDFLAAEINLDVYDFEGDGVPEIIGTHFFNGDQITIYGAPSGQIWSDVHPIFNPARAKDIATGQGNPFEIEIVDLNLDGKVDVLATNHQGDDCFEVTAAPIAGRVFAIEQPASGDLFNDDWPLHILKDDIRPNPTFPEPTMGPGRLAPGRAIAFWPVRWQEDFFKPWIVLGGDEAGKVWILTPNSQLPGRWDYGAAVIFDVNDFYGPNASQSFIAPPPSQGTSISTIGGQAVRYDAPGLFGLAEIYIPVFESRDIHKFSFRFQGFGTQVDCLDDVQIECPARD